MKENSLINFTEDNFESIKHIDEKRTNDCVRV